MKNKKEKNRYLTGFSKFIFYQYLKLYVFLKYFKRYLTGDIRFKQYIVFLKRVLFLFDKIKINKVVKTRGVYKMHIYLPAFPTPAFFVALDKFLLQKKPPEEINPTSVLLSMTKACNYNCPHCYQKNDPAEPMSLDKLREVGRQIQNLNISYINIEGGEPMVNFDRLVSLLEVLDEEESEIWINTNGYNVTKEKAQKLDKLGVFGVMVSLHHWKEKEHDQFVGFDGAYKKAISALETFHKAGISTAVNCTGTRELIENDSFPKIMYIAKKLNCAMVQLIHEKPAGGWLKRRGTLKKEYVKKLCKYHIDYSVGRECKNYPAISSQAYESLKNNFGCTAGGIERFYINASGEVQPCEFVNITFGNLTKEPFSKIYKRMRRVFNKPKTNWICCTENRKISKKMDELDKKKTPLPERKSKEIIENLELGEETPLYKKMNLYEG